MATWDDHDSSVDDGGLTMNMMPIAIHNVEVFMIEETQCSGNGFPCMAESQVAFSKEKIVPHLV